jgi:dolichol kinase
MTETFSYRAELGRKALHVGALAIPIGILVLEREVSLVILTLLAAVAFAGDILRSRVPAVRGLVHGVFAPLMRPSERPPLREGLVINGATWMCLGAAICVLWLPPVVAATSLAMLMVGDAAAALVGRRWGQTRYPGSEKSLEGSVAFVISAWLVALPFAASGEPAIGPLVLLMGALGGAVLEALPLPVNDNVHVPVLAGLLMLSLL